MSDGPQEAPAKNTKPPLLKRIKRIASLVKERWQRSSRYAKTAGIVLMCILTGVLAAAIVLLLRPKNEPAVTSSASRVCSDSILKKAVASMGPNQQKKLGSVVEQIQQKTDFDHDPNCLYVLMVYYVEVSDAGNSKHYWEKFKAFYNANTPLNKILITNAAGPTLQNMDEAIQFLEKADKENTKPKFEPGKNE